MKYVQGFNFTIFFTSLLFISWLLIHDSIKANNSFQLPLINSCLANTAISWRICFLTSILGSSTIVFSKNCLILCLNYFKNVYLHITKLKQTINKNLTYCSRSSWDKFIHALRLYNFFLNTRAAYSFNLSFLLELITVQRVTYVWGFFNADVNSSVA